MPALAADLFLESEAGNVHKAETCVSMDRIHRDCPVWSMQVFALYTVHDNCTYGDWQRVAPHTSVSEMHCREGSSCTRISGCRQRRTKCMTSGRQRYVTVLSPPCANLKLDALPYSGTREFR